MFKKLLISLVVIFSLIAVPVYAGDAYVALKASTGKTDIKNIKLSNTFKGSVIHDTSRDTITSPGFAIGYDTGKYRVELEYFKREMYDHEVSFTEVYNTDEEYECYDPLYYNIRAEVDTETFFLNLYADFLVAKKLEFYVGAGAGIAKHYSKVNYKSNSTLFVDYSGSNTCMAYNVQTGIVYLINNNVAFDLGLRHADLGKVKLGNFLKAGKMTSKEAVLALRYTF